MFKHSSGYRYVDVESLWKAENIKRLVKDRYCALSNSIVNAEQTKGLIVTEVVRNVNEEIKKICLDEHSSILLDNHEAVKKFSWRTIWMELNTCMPILMKLLTGFVRNWEDKIPMLCLIASMLLKARWPRMALAQRAISIFLYGNGASKQVHNNIKYNDSNLSI